MFEELIISFASDEYILLESNILAMLYSYRQITLKSRESGGVLIGQYRGAHIRVDSMTQPGEEDLSNRTRFYRRGQHHGIQVYNSWMKSQHTSCWIGDWHTHPEATPTPSFIDMNSWAKNYYGRPMVSVIVGTEALWVGLFKNKNYSSRLIPHGYYLITP